MDKSRISIYSTIQSQSFTPLLLLRYPSKPLAIRA